MNEKISLSYRLVVGVMIVSIVGVFVYMDKNYQTHDSRDLRGISNTSLIVAEFGNSSSPSEFQNVPDEPEKLQSDESMDQNHPRSDYFAERLLAMFDEASVVDSEEVVEADGSLLKRDVLLTEEKYPLITREIRYSFDETNASWVPVDGSAWVADQVLMGLEDGQNVEALEPILQDFNAELVQNVRDGNHFLIRFKNADPNEMDETLTALRLYGAVAYAEPNFYRISTVLAPNDSSFHNLWALNNLGSGSGVYDADIDALEAWDVTHGDSNVVVAVIDTGIQIDHPDLVGRIYYNLGEEINGVDDDGNGYIDDINGWNFYDLNLGNNNVQDTSLSHGTHVAGIIAATGNNQRGVVGVSPGVTVLPVKIFNDQGGYASDLIRGMDYAADMGASIINVSLGGSDSSQAEISMIDELQRRGILLVVSSGNSGLDGDVYESFPGSYSHQNILNVAASNWFDEMETYSTWGNESVDICAPGTQILSTIATDSYEYYTGTSMAAPHVSGVAALVKSVRTDWDASMLKDAILSTADPIPSAVGKTVSGGRVNAASAVLYARENTFFPNGLHIRIKSAANGLYVHPEEMNSSAQLVAEGASAGRAEVFEVIAVEDSIYAFKSVANGKYVTVEAGGLEPLSATRDEISDWELFYPINQGDGTYAFRSKANGLIVSAENDGNDPLIANRDSVGEWETFEIETLHLLPVGEMVVLQSAQSGLFVSPNVNGVLQPIESVAGLRNIFKVGLSMDGFLTLQSFDTGAFVSAKTTGTIPVTALSESAGDWEKFVAIAHENGHIVIRCKANGKLLTTGNNGTASLVANGDAVTSSSLFNPYVLPK